jgi:hypothetical protein
MLPIIKSVRWVLKKRRSETNSFGCDCVLLCRFWTHSTARFQLSLIIEEKTGTISSLESIATLKDNEISVLRSHAMELEASIKVLEWSMHAFFDIHFLFAKQVHIEENRDLAVAMKKVLKIYVLH